MFILKKFQKQNSESGAGPNNGVSSNSGGPLVNGSGGHGYQPMGQNLQKKFARGIQYNMKIIIRGDRNVGKTCLYHRLQGGKFYEEYAPSEEIQVASIHWNYNASDDIVKVEIWDVVDKGKKRESIQSSNSKSGNSSSGTNNPKDILKMHNNQSTTNNSSSSTTNGIGNNGKIDSKLSDKQPKLPITESPVLDAEFVDVYKATNGVIFLFDMTKAWTFEYVEREVRRCPLQIPIMILANHRDMGHHRVITSDQVQGLIDTVLKEDAELGRTRTGQIRHAESSMRNGFGLRYLYKFFNLPYLHLQRETLLKQLDRNLNEIGGTCQELDLLMESDDHNYDLFLEMITNRRRQVADQLSCLPNSSNGSGSTSGGPPPRSISMPANIAASATNHPNNSHNHHHNDSSKQNSTNLINKPTPSIIIGANNPLPSKFQHQLNQPKSTKLNSNSSNASNNNSVKQLAANVVSTVTKSTNSVDNNTRNSQSNNGGIVGKTIDDFIPEDSEHNMFRKFLDEPTVLPQEMEGFPSTINEEDSEEEDDDDNELNKNPMVAKYQEELDPEDLIDDNDSSELNSRPNPVPNKDQKNSKNKKKKNSFPNDYVNKRNQLVKECIEDVDEDVEDISSDVIVESESVQQLNLTPDDQIENASNSSCNNNETLPNIDDHSQSASPLPPSTVANNNLNPTEPLQKEQEEITEAEVVVVVEVEQQEEVELTKNHLTLNCDEIDALEKLYISNNNNSHNQNQNSATATTTKTDNNLHPKTKPTSNKKSSNKKKSNKTIAKQSLVEDNNNNSGNKTSKKLKNKQSKIKIRNVEDYYDPHQSEEQELDILERERRQLEDFLGGGGGSGSSGHGSASLEGSIRPDPNSYQML